MYYCWLPRSIFYFSVTVLYYSILLTSTKKICPSSSHIKLNQTNKEMYNSKISVRNVLLELKSCHEKFPKSIIVDKKYCSFLR